MATIRDEFDTLTRNIKREVYDQVESTVQDAIDTALNNIADDVADSISVEVEDKISDMLDNINDAVSNAIGQPTASAMQPTKLTYETHTNYICDDTFKFDIDSAGVLIDLILYATAQDCTVAESAKRITLLRQLANRLKYHSN